ncbi:class I SAM-dependent methyltransferase [Streptomyces microflavus]|uniref:Methyltransferase type 11 n=1 Tax=Streptomyces microflavus TaxID=1919 RepID=A0A7J0CRW3_STRMI|nr:MULTISPECIES: methyltransferase domain-containing protein [Streptomyces]MDX2979655.1 methyltransferase domain-containing protein [Streptomyces sp. NRRL_B-2249]WSS35552.1 class I SAM-dependent methyltransferase [Streptomyces microflavus]WST15882.1 class I SAM-dependent methyltransferase [Streptomyces microflavus]GFN05212.1 methyltransferase type 11 [Streptomyces microflavus]GGX51295.1 methyltransferase type 11 [Streptomyces microflavus]
MSTTLPPSSSGTATQESRETTDAPDAPTSRETTDTLDVGPETEPGLGAEARTAPWGTDPYANALRNGHGPLFLRRSDGWLLPLEVERWCSDAGSADLSALHRCEGPVLDIGCGPGRLVAELSALGHRALGIDVSEAAVARTRRIGGSALLRSVFDPLPGEGRWGTVLLVDGNIGIGGDPAALLDRAAELLSTGGLLIAETSPLDIDERVQVRLDDGLRTPAEKAAPGPADRPFPWARIGTPALLRYADACGWRPADQWSAEGRAFVSLRRPRPPVRDRSARTSSQSAESANNAPVISSQWER